MIEAVLHDGKYLMIMCGFLQMSHPRYCIAGDDGFQFLLNCTNFTYQQLKSFNLARGITGTFCLLMSFVILVLLLRYFKAYKSTMQRLILYNAVLTTLYQAGNVLQLEHQFSYTGQDIVCAILGAFYMYIANVTFTFAAVIITYLLYSVLKSYITGSQLKLNSYFVESVCVAVAFILPLTFLWSPFLHNGFGLGGFYCWIKDTDINCSNDYTDLIIMYSVSEVISVEMLMASCFMFVVYCRMQTQVKQHYINSLIQKTCFLVSLHAVGFAIVTVAFSVVFYLLVGNVFVPNQSLMFSVGTIFPIFYEFALIVLFIVSMRTSKIQNRRQRLHAVHTKNLQTRPSKSSFVPTTQPSNTTFTVPYTGAFTDITTESVHEEEIPLTSNM